MIGGGAGVVVVTVTVTGGGAGVVVVTVTVGGGGAGVVTVVVEGGGGGGGGGEPQLRSASPDVLPPPSTVQLALAVT